MADAEDHVLPVVNLLATDSVNERERSSPEERASFDQDRLDATF